jgi:hypothetical protein
VTVTLIDGHRHSAACEHAKGDPEAPLSRQEMLNKARMLMSFGGIREPDEEVKSILALVDDGPLPTLELG